MTRALHFGLTVAVLACFVWWHELVEVVGPAVAYIAMMALVLILAWEIKRALRGRLWPQEQNNG